MFYKVLFSEVQFENRFLLILKFEFNLILDIKNSKICQIEKAFLK